MSAIDYIRQSQAHQKFRAEISTQSNKTNFDADPLRLSMEPQITIGIVRELVKFNLAEDWQCHITADFPVPDAKLEIHRLNAVRSAKRGVFWISLWRRPAGS